MSEKTNKQQRLLKSVTVTETVIHRFHYSAAVAQEVERSSTNWKMCGLIPGSFSPHVDGSLGKILNTKLLLLLRQQCMDVYEWLVSS